MKNKEDIFRLMGSSNHSDIERAKNDYYSTPKVAVEKLISQLEKLNITLPNLIVEPSVGSGNIANSFLEKGHNILAYDIVNRGFPNTNVCDWLEVNERPEEDLAIVANFPFYDINKHTIHSLQLLKDGEYLIELAKIQFLETKGRKMIFEKFPPKYVLVFSERIKCLANDIDDHKQSAICFCWFIFQKGFTGLPQICWI